MCSARKRISTFQIYWKGSEKQKEKMTGALGAPVFFPLHQYPGPSESYGYTQMPQDST